MEREFVIKEPADFTAVVEEILKPPVPLSISGAVVVALRGELGAGKTTFTQVLGRTLGVAEPITSPTFIVMKSYEVDHEQFDTLVHLDAYRIEDESELVPLKLSELLNRPRTIVCIEWPERISKIIPEEACWIDIEIVKTDERQAILQVKTDE